MNLDDKIKEALKMEEQEVEQILREDQGLFAQLAAVFKGNMKGWNLFGLLLATVTAIIMFYSGYQFFINETLDERVFWGVIFIVSWTGNMGLKIYFWLEMNKNATVREIKRVELAITRLAAQSN
tara:strand:+ start:134 stop:505 length:372 start_codon:yes stop_codon:yes gene_type:complete